MQKKHLVFAIILFLSACQSSRVTELVIRSEEEIKNVKPEIEYAMRVIIPDSTIQYKARHIRPDSTLTYHILIVDPER